MAEEDIERLRAELARVDHKLGTASPEGRRAQVATLWDSLRTRGLTPTPEDLQMGDRYVSGEIDSDLFWPFIYDRFGSAL
jgi:hypothetical protein